ncbi:MAG: VIT1/CCC1 transporter family protein [Ilumatobacter sp.]|uniref:VIT1/CCC1 transporter family protein n=1 Tax=Ilumatobacter sp. TaxID=1967498 RepID=UPI003C75E4C2
MSAQPYTPTSASTPVDPGRDAEQLQARVTTVSRGAARAAVLGVNDGLVTTVCLVLAVAGASSGVAEVRIAGLASLIAGAFSMAAGEWISVRSQVELFDGIVNELHHLSQRNPRLLLDALTSKLEDSGLATDTAQRVATELPLEGDRFVDFTARTVFGFDPGEVGSPTVAAASSFGLFTAGAVVPLAPWFLTSGTAAIVASVTATALASLVVGGWVSKSSANPVAQGASRQLAIVLVASVVTYGIGALFGTAIG